MFSTLNEIAQLFFKRLSQLVTFRLIFPKKYLRQACLEKGQSKKIRSNFLFGKFSHLRNWILITINRRHLAIVRQRNTVSAGKMLANGACFLRLPV
jgi:hypothetical protein